MQPHRAALGHPRSLTLNHDGTDFRLLYELAADTQSQAPSASFRISADELERLFGQAEVQMAALAGRELRYLYANESYRRIRPEVPMVGRTYREVFPEAAEAGAEARLQSVIATSQAWLVDDYPTELPGRDVPAWWQGQCVPIDLAGTGRPDGVLILIWDVTHRHLPDRGPPAKSEGRLRIESARAKLAARMAAAGLTAEEGWRISEEVVETDGATVWTLRPLHLRHPSPTGMLERVEFERLLA